MIQWISIGTWWGLLQCSNVFILQFLIFLQVYSALFHGVAYGNLVAEYEEQIKRTLYLDSGVDGEGALYLTLGTEGIEGALKILKHFNVPSYASLNHQRQGERGIEWNGITRFSEGIGFSLEGLQFSLGKGVMRVKGSQMERGHPLVLRGGKNVVLRHVKACALDLRASHIVTMGKSTLDSLALEGVGQDALFVNSGTLRVEKLTLKQLHTLNGGVMKVGSVEALGGSFQNGCVLRCQEKIKLDLDRFMNSGQVSAKILEVLVKKPTNHCQSRIDIQDSSNLEVGITNRGTLRAREYSISGPSFSQQGVLRGKSLTVSGIDEKSIFVNEGCLRVRDLFLKRLLTTNSKLMEMDSFDAQEGTLTNGGDFEAHANIKLKLDSVINSGHVIAHNLQGSLGVFENKPQGHMIVDDALKVRGCITNEGTLEASEYELRGPIFHQRGHLKGTRARIKNIKLLTGKDQEIHLEDFLDVCSHHPWVLKGVVCVKDFDSSGAVDIKGSLKTQLFKGYGTLQATGKLKSEKVHCVGDFIALGSLDTQVLYADGSLSTRGDVYVGHEVELKGVLEILEGGHFSARGIGGELSLINSGHVNLEVKNETGEVLENCARINIDQRKDARAIKIQGTNQAKGICSVKGGIFDLRDFINEGTLRQDEAWLSLAGNQGLWRSSGDLKLIDYRGEPLSKVEVRSALHIDTAVDGLEVCSGLGQVSAEKVIIDAPEVSNTAEWVLPWSVELRLERDFANTGRIYTRGLQLSCRNFENNGEIFADVKAGTDLSQSSFSRELGFLKVTAEKAEVNTTGYLFGKKGVGVEARDLTINGLQNTGASQGSFLYRRTGSGLYSAEGPIALHVKGTMNNIFGTVQGPFFDIQAQDLINTGGFIRGKDASQSSQIVTGSLANQRSNPSSYAQFYDVPVAWGYTWYNEANHCNGCNGKAVDHPNTWSCNKTETRWRSVPYETSAQAIIEHAGNLTLVYKNLTNEVSDITSGGTLVLNHYLGAHLNLVGDLQGRAPGITVTRNGYGGHNSLIRGKSAVNGTLGNAMIEGRIQGSSVKLRAAQMTLESLGFTGAQGAGFLSLVHSMNESSLYRLTEEGIDTRFPFASLCPRSIVGLGSIPDNLNMRATWNAWEHAFGQNFPYLYRGLDYLGLSFTQLCEITAQEVKQRKGGQVHRRSITLGDASGKETHEVEVVTCSEMTTLEDMRKSAFPMVVAEFGRNIAHVEHVLEREAQAKKAEVKVQDLGARAQKALAVTRFADTKDHEDIEFNLFVPADAGGKGIVATKGRCDIAVTEGDFINRSSSISGHGGSFFVPKGNIKMLSRVTRSGDGDNFRESFTRPTLENKGEGADFAITGGKNMEIEGAHIQTSGPNSSITLQVPGHIVDRAVALQSRQTFDEHSKRSHTHTVIDETTMYPTLYTGPGKGSSRVGLW